jgi:hypothetical protein
MTTLLPGIVAAGAASLAINGSYLVQHAGLSRAPAVRAARPLATVRALLASPTWRAGAALGYGGLALETVGLALAPLSLVQSVIAAGLVVVALGSARAIHRREAAAVGLIALALVALAIAPAHIAEATAPGAAGLAALLALAGAAGGVLTRGAGPARLGLAAGVLYGATTVALSSFLAAARHGAWTSPTALLAVGGGALVTAGGFFAFQRGLQLGRPAPVVTLMTAGTNAVAIAGGLLLLGDGLGGTAWARALHLCAFAAVPVAAALAAPRLVKSAP